jgi:hypothetical protein
MGWVPHLGCQLAAFQGLLLVRNLAHWSNVARKRKFAIYAVPQLGRRRNSSGSLAILTAMRRASSRASYLAATAVGGPNAELIIRAIGRASKSPTVS